MKKIGVLLVASLASPLLWAHEGHAGGTGASHDLQHAMWLLGGIAVAAVAVALIRYGKWSWWK